MRFARFLDFLFPPRSDEVLMRSITADSLLSLVRPTLVPETRPGTHSLLPFHQPPVRALLHEAKYHGNPRAFELLGLALGDYLADLDLLGSKQVVVIPVPLGHARQKEREFNQVEEVIKRAIPGLSLTLAPELLVRTRETASQVSLPRAEREKNMKGAFKITRTPDPACTYIVVDDVITTGATLQSALDTLQSAGARDVIPLALAH